MSADENAGWKVEFQRVVTLQSEIVVVIMVRRQVVEDGGAVLLRQEPAQVPLHDVQALTYAGEAGIEHLRSAPAASLPDDFTRFIQVDVIIRGHAETARDNHTGSTQSLHSLRHEGCPALAQAT